MGDTMKALVFYGPYDVRLCRDRPKPRIENNTDVIVKTTTAALCGSELHRYRGHSKVNMDPGYVCGHEGMGVVDEVGSAVRRFKTGNHVVVAFTSSCGACSHCLRGITTRCLQAKNFGSVLLDGSQAQYFRVPMADSCLFHVPPELDLGDLMILMTDIFPTGFWASRNAFTGIPESRYSTATVVFVGCGPVGLCAIICASQNKPMRMIAVDAIGSRLDRAESLGCIPLNFTEVNVTEQIMRLTDGTGADLVIEAVGSGAALRTAWEVISPGGKISSVGLHNGEMPFTAGDAYDKNVQLQFGCCPVAAVFEDALQVLTENKAVIQNLGFIDTVLPDLDGSFDEALKKFDKGEINKVIFKPNGLAKV